MKDEIENVFKEFYNELYNYVEMQRKEEWLEELDIEKSIEWLKKVQLSDGSWRFGDVATTSEVLLTFHEYGIPVDEDWDTYIGIVGGVQKALDWLQTRFEGGSIKGNLWDTAIALRALKNYSIKLDSINEVLEWVKNSAERYIEEENFDKLHHISQALLALKAWDSSDYINIKNKFIEMIKTNIDELKTLDLYRLGQLQELLQYEDAVMMEKVERIIIEKLKRYSYRLDEGNFDNVVMAMIGLSIRRNTVNYEEEKLAKFDQEIMKLIESYLAKIQEESRRKEDGSWYADPKKTARAIRALLTVKTAPVIKIQPTILWDKTLKTKNRVQTIFDEYAKIIKIIRKNIYVVNLLSICAGMLVVLAVNLFYYKSPWAPTFFEIVVGSIIASLIIKIFNLSSKLCECRLID